MIGAAPPSQDRPLIVPAILPHVVGGFAVIVTVTGLTQ